MPLKIVHCADLHIGAPCQGLSTEKAEMRSEEIRLSLSDIADFCKEKEVDALLICGDLFDSPSPSKTDCDFVKDVLLSLSPVEVFIVCGNHDYMCAQSPFAKENYFSENVHIFPCFEHCFTIGNKNAVFWGKSCSSNYISPSFEDFTPVSDMLNILCLHGDITDGSSYNIITKDTLSSLSCNYVAFGHIHSGEIFEIGHNKCAYPGTPEGHKFNDDGVTGFIYAEISKESTSIFPICLTKRKYRNIKLDVSEKSSEEIIDILKEKLNENDFFRLTLFGEIYTDKEISTQYILNELKDHVLHLEISDETTRAYNLNEIEKEDSLRGFFLREIRKSTSSEEEFITSAKMGLDALSGKANILGGAL